MNDGPRHSSGGRAEDGRASRTLHWCLDRRWAFYGLLMAALGGVVAYVTYDEDRALDGAQTAPATVLDISRMVRGGPAIDIEIALPDGRTVRTTTSSFIDDRPHKGDQIQVEYVIQGRDVLAREVGANANTNVWSMAVLGGAGLTVAAIVLVRRSPAWQHRHWAQFWYYGSCPDCGHDWRFHPEGVYNKDPTSTCTDCRSQPACYLHAASP